MRNSLSDVTWAVTTKFKVFPTLLRGKHKGCKDVYRPRMIAIYLAREFTGRSFPEIGRWFGRDHTTCIHACRRVRHFIDTEPQTRAWVEELSEALPHMAKARHEALEPSVARLLAGEKPWTVVRKGMEPARY